MTRQKNRLGIGTHRPPDDRTPRVLLKPHVQKTGCVDGAWWPYSDQLTTELPGLLTVLATRLGTIRRVAYHLGEWASVRGELAFNGQTVRLDGYHHGTADTIEVLGARNRRLILLVVPPHTDAHHAFTTMTCASGADNESTVDELLMIDGRERAARTGRAAALRRWRLEREVGGTRRDDGARRPCGDELGAEPPDLLATTGGNSIEDAEIVAAQQRWDSDGGAAGEQP
ncbi:DUF5994 family protein [Nocardia jiangxiensis]|uniref:DUF5994 family protein n=1 Tax=Nocardia jiangxiensis TaxID=282685 RepID=A0ABW6RRG4_9NOCA|nr:DUF5994 family protein [Nocardia jiangxiensis]